MSKIEVSQQNKERIEKMEHHIEVANKEMGEIRDCISEFKRENAVEHTRIFESLKNQNIYISDIKDGITKLGWGLSASVIILIISIVITNIIK